MKRVLVIVLAAAGLGGLVAVDAAAADAAPAATIQYRPPLRGAPAVRIGGATRSLTRVAPAFTYLAPDHVGLSLRAQPTFYWHAAMPPAADMLFRLSALDGASPAVEQVLPAGACAGLYRVRLADLGVALRPDVDYRWQVVFANGQGRASSVSGWVRLGEAVPDFAERLRRGAPGERASLLADAGVWYDAVDELMAQKASPEAGAALATLLAQGGMPPGTAEAPACFR